MSRDLEVFGIANNLPQLIRSSTWVVGPAGDRGYTGDILVIPTPYLHFHVSIPILCLLQFPFLIQNPHLGVTSKVLLVISGV